MLMASARDTLLSVVQVPLGLNRSVWPSRAAKKGLYGDNAVTAWAVLNHHLLFTPSCKCLTQFSCNCISTCTGGAEGDEAYRPAWPRQIGIGAA